MSTSSLYHNVVIDTDEAAERLLDALENPANTAMEPVAYTPVSYTHLDVYKRQEVEKKKNILGETSVLISSYEKSGSVEPY